MIKKHIAPNKTIKILDKINILCCELEAKGRKTVKISDINDIIMGYGLDYGYVKLK